MGAGIGIGLLLAMRRRVRAHLVELVELCRTGRRGLWVALGVSLATHCCFAFGIHLAARAAHLEIGFAQALFAVSAAMLFVVLPVSFAGVSPVEAAGLGVLVSMGIPVDQAAIFVLLSYLAKVVGAFEGAAWEIVEGGHDASRGLFGRETPSSKAPGKL